MRDVETMLRIREALDAGHAITRRPMANGPGYFQQHKWIHGQLIRDMINDGWILETPKGIKGAP